jgi:cell shape-determining protein MreC
MNLSMVSPFQLIILGAVLTFVISDHKEAGALNVLGNLIVSVGSLILTVAAQEEFIKTKKEEKLTKEEIRKQILDLHEKYAKLECTNF